MCRWQVSFWVCATYVSTVNSVVRHSVGMSDVPWSKLGETAHMGGCSPIHQWIFTYHDLLYNFWMTMPHPTHVIWQSPVFFGDWGQSKFNTPIHHGFWGVGLRWTGDGSNKKHSASHNVRIQPLPAKDPSVTASVVADISDAMLAS